jgi:hypothetical protein
MGVIREGRLKDGHGELHLYCGEDGKGAGDSGNVGPSVVEILEAAMFVVRETVYLFASVCPTIGRRLWCGLGERRKIEIWRVVRDRGRVGHGWWSRRSRRYAVVSTSVFAIGSPVLGSMEMPWKILKSVCWWAIRDSIWVTDICSCSMNCSRCFVMNDMSRGEKRRSSPCAERNASCAWMERLASARICRQCCV